jgi:hypothetical protein
MALVAVTLIVPRAGHGDDQADEIRPPTPKRWSVYADTGLQYDSNVALDPSGQRLPGTPAAPADEAVVFGAGGRYDLIDTPHWQADVEYDLYQTLHFRLDDFNLRSNRLLATAGYAVTPALWTGTQLGYQHFALGGPGYSSAPFVIPFVSYTEGKWGLTQLVYQHAEVTYLSQPFENVRDGPIDTAGLNQTLYWKSRSLTVGYEFGSERPRSAAGDDYRERYQQGSIDFGFSPGWRTTIDLVYLFRHENYPDPNSAVNFQTNRRDSVSQFSVSVQRPLNAHFSVALAYYGTVDDSNIAVYTYRRNIAMAQLRVDY